MRHALRKLSGPRVAIWVAIPLAVAGLLVPIPYGERWVSVLGDLVHAPLFGCLAFLMLRWIDAVAPVESRRGKWLVRVGLAATFVFAAGIAMEVVQTQLSRTGTIHDAISNGLGIFAASALYVSVAIRGTRAGVIAIRLVMLVAAALAIGWASRRPVSILWDVVALRREFPLIGSFEREAELTRWYFRDVAATREGRHATDGDASLQLRPLRGPTSDEPPIGALLLEIPPDWTGMTELRLDVTLTDSNRPVQRLWLRLMDRRYPTDPARSAAHESRVLKHEFLITHGLNRLRLERLVIDGFQCRPPLALRKMVHLELQFPDARPGDRINVDHVRLRLSAEP